MDDPTTGRNSESGDVQLLTYQRAPLAGEEDEDDQPPPTPPPPLPPPSAPLGPPPPRPTEGPKTPPPPTTNHHRDEEAARFVEDCSRPRPVRGTVHLLSSLYARLLLSVVLVLLLTEILPNGRPLLFFHGYLFSFVLGAGLLCLLCVYVSVVVQRCPGMEEVHEMELSDTSPCKVPRISGFFRMGLFVFGLGTLIGVGLAAATLFSAEKPCMDQINWVQPLLLAAFTLLQTHVLCLDSQRSMGYLGWCRHPVLMHLSAANLAIWMRMFLWDGADAWLKQDHTFTPNPTAHSLDKEGRHSVHVSYDCAWQVQTPDVVEDLLQLRNCHRNSTLGVIWWEARPFIAPFVFQYCIAASIVLYALWRSPPSSCRPTPLAPTQSQRMDCRGSSKGLFLGLLVLAVGIVALILYFVLAHNPGLKEETLLVMVSAHAGLLLLALLASLLGLCRVGGMCARADPDPCSTLHRIFQGVGLCALFVQSCCALVAALQDEAALAAIAEGGQTISTSLVTLADAGLCILHALLQSVLFHRLEQRRCSSGCPHEGSRPGRQVVTFLAFCNLVLWVTDTFAGGRDHSSAHLQVQLFGALPWKLISQLTMPLVMLYRFQSTVYLLEAWNTGYGTDPK